MNVIPCRTYHAQTVGRSLLRMPDRQSAFKVYYVSIVGRDDPTLYEWKSCPLTHKDFERSFLSGEHRGVGFVVAFPHVTEVYRFSPGQETLLEVRTLNTADMTVRDCSRSDGYHELACYADVVIAADEYRAWAEARTVDEYLAVSSGAADFPIVRNAKLAAYWNGL